MRNKIGKIWTKYSAVSIIARASLWYTICSILQKGIALLATPIFTRLLSTNQYGLYTVYQSWYSIILIFATLNLYWNSYNNVLTKFGDDKDIATSSMQGLSTSVTCIFILLYFVKPSFWNALFGLPTVLMVVMLAQLLFEPALNFWMVRQRYEYKYKGVVAVTLINAILSTGVGVLCVIISHEKGIARVLVYACTQIVIGFIFYIYHLLKGKHFFSKFYWVYSLKFCIPLIPHYLSFSVLNQADRIMISSMIGQGEAAIYSVAYTIAMMMQIVTQSITNSLTPYTYQAIKKQSTQGLKKTVSALLLFLAVICIMVMLFSPEVLRLFASEDYFDAIYVMPPVVASTFFLFLYPLFSIVEFYYERTKFIMIASSLGAITNIILNYIFITKFGYYAAGFTTLFCYIMFSIAHYCFYRIILNKEMGHTIDLYDRRIICFTSLVVLIATIVSMYLYRFGIIRYILILIMIIALVWKRNAIFELLKMLKTKG